MTHTLPIERAYAYAQSMMAAIPRVHWLSAAKVLAGDPADWTEGYEQVLRAALAARIIDGPTSIRVAAEVIGKPEWKEGLERAAVMVIKRRSAFMRTLSSLSR